MSPNVYLQRTFEQGSARTLQTAAVAVTAAITVGTLYFARDVLIPLTLAGLLSFILAPAVRMLRRARVPRTGSVVIVVALAIGLCAGLTAVISSQLVSLAHDLPLYESNLRQKIREVRSSQTGDSALERASTTLKELGREIEGNVVVPADGVTPTAPLIDRQRQATTERETAVVLKQPVETPLKVFEDMISPLLAPLASAGIVFLFMIFILLQREDIRDRFIRLFGSRDLNRTTMAMNDAAVRLSRFFLIQALLNGLFGIAVGVALSLIGIPSPVLWGMLAAIMRFVPYLGSIVAAVFPIALAAAVDPGWTMVGLTALVFVIGEPLMGHIVEPLVFGKQTGLSPLAIVSAATFWTWLWGPIGLILATPLTLCLVVLGQHVEKFEFLSVLLGSEPALAPEQSFYQRLLAGDAAEVKQQAESMLKQRDLVDYYDRVALPGLRLGQYDEQHNNLDEDRIEEVREAIDELIETLDDAELGASKDAAGKADKRAGDDGDEPEGMARLDAVAADAGRHVEAAHLAPAWREPGAIVIVPGRGNFDLASARMLEQLLKKAGFGAETRGEGGLTGIASAFKSEDSDRVMRIVVSTVGAVTPAQIRLLVRHAERALPGKRIIVGDWAVDSENSELAWMRKNTGADAVFASFSTLLSDFAKTARALPAGNDDEPEMTDKALLDAVTRTPEASVA